MVLTFIGSLRSVMRNVVHSRRGETLKQTDEPDNSSEQFEMGSPSKNKTF